MTRWIVFFAFLVVVFAGVVGVYRTFINPKYLKVQGHKVLTKEVMQAYYHLHPEVSATKRVSHKNAVESFLIQQDQYQTYLKQTAHHWFEGHVVESREGILSDEEGQNPMLVMRYMVQLTNGNLVSGYQDWDHSQEVKVGDYIRMLLGSEFTELSNDNRLNLNHMTQQVPFSSRIERLLVRKGSKFEVR